MAFTPVIEESVGMDSPHHQHGEVLLSLLARHKSLEGKKHRKLCLKFYGSFYLPREQESSLKVKRI